MSDIQAEVFGVGSVLLERSWSQRESGRILMFRDPVRVLKTWKPHEVAAQLAEIEGALAKGLYLAGFLAYEAGYALEPSLADLAAEAPGGEPLLWLGCYRSVEVQETGAPSADHGQPAPEARIRFSLTEEDYARKVDAVQSLIAAGETYQANLTMTADWQTDEPAIKMYQRLIQSQPVPYGALLRPRPGLHVLSFSPELFFRREGLRMVTRPMKGTATPGLDMDETRERMAWLQTDEKNRAENVMIVDLLRNDLGRVCERGSVRATELFHVERYPSVLQMTSTVEGRLRAGVSYGDIFRALFPSGSIVGAPKVNTMRRLHALEGRRRGVYTGAIGYIAPDRTAEFNVAIRTIVLQGREAQMGVGSGIVADSRAPLEYEECRTKTAFLTRDADEDFSLIETLLLDEGRYFLLEHHLERMAGSAEYFDMPFDVGQARNVLEKARLRTDARRARLRLLLDRNGRFTWTATELSVEENAPVDVLVWPGTVRPDDRFLRHKTTRRARFDEALRSAQSRGCADALFLNVRGEWTEGAIHNVIVALDGAWVTPPLVCGTLPGVYRRKLLEEGRVTERVLHRNDLSRATAVFLCNSVRGLRPVRAIRSEMEIAWAAPGAMGA